MRKVMFGLAVAGVAGWFLWTKFQPPPPRLTTALEEAKKENKLVLLDFTGSDWCGWCIKLHEEALGKPEFINYASKYLVTLVVDFPAHRTMPGELKRANKALKDKYDVSGFPTLVALSPDGKVVWKQTGYMSGGPFAVIAPLNRSRMALGMPAAELAPISTLAATPVKPAPEKSTLASATATTRAAGPPVPHGLPVDAPKLQGIIYSQPKPSVILGGWQCAEGESVRGMRVVKILKDKVTVEWEGHMEELTMQ